MAGEPWVEPDSCGKPGNAGEGFVPVAIGAVLDAAAAAGLCSGD